MRVAFLPYGALQVAVACMEPLGSYDEVVAVLEHFEGMAPERRISLVSEIVDASATSDDYFYPVLQNRVFHYWVDPNTELKVLEELNAVCAVSPSRWYVAEHPSTEAECYVVYSATAPARLLGQFCAIVRSNVPLSYMEVREYVDGCRANIR